MIAWIESMVLPSESAWSVIQKFAWLNEAKPWVLLRDLYDLDAALGGQRRGWLDSPDWLAKLSWKGSERSEPLLKGVPLPAALAKLAEPCAGDLAYQLSTQLRTCRQCLQTQGYHAWWHQLVFLNRCPFHETVLCEGCPSCGRDLEYVVAPEQAPYGCRRCGGLPSGDERWVPACSDIFPKVLFRAEWILRWIKASERFVAHVPDRELLPELGWRVPPSPPDVKAFLIAQRSPGVRLTHLGPRPANCVAHSYESLGGELIQMHEASDSSQQASFALSVRNLIQEVSQSLLSEFKVLHPCLTESLLLDGRTSLSAADAARCAIAVGHAVWARKATKLVKDLEDASYFGRAVSFSAALADIKRALTSDLYAMMYWVSLPNQMDKTHGGHGRRNDATGSYFLEWVEFAPDSAPTDRIHLRPELDYAEWVRERKCAKGAP